MANNIELPCPDDCPLKGMTHQHLQKVEGQPHKRKNKKRRQNDDEPTNFRMSRRNRRARR